MLIIGGLGSGKINVLLNLLKNQRPDIRKKYLYAKDPFKSKYRLVFNRREKARIEKEKTLKDPLIIHKQFMMFMKIQKKKRVLIVFDDIIAAVEANKKLSPIVNE